MAFLQSGLTDYLLFLKIIKQCRDDELEHHDIGLEHDAERVSTVLTNWCCSNSNKIPPC